METSDSQSADVQITCSYINSLFKETSPFLPGGGFSESVIHSVIVQTVSYCLDHAPSLTYKNVAALVLKMAEVNRELGKL